MDAYQVITDRIIAFLEEGTIPWKKPWNGVLRNLKTGHEYRGINVWILVASRFVSPFWLTFKQTKEMGGSVKAGEKSTMIVFWEIHERVIVTNDLDEHGDRVVKLGTVPLMRVYSVFNVAQTTLEVPSESGKPNDPIQAAEAIVKGMPLAPPIMNVDPSQAFYSPSQDIVNVPLMELFTSSEEYYSTLFHELTHSTGHPSRLGRFDAGTDHTFGSIVYSKEELVAEMGASFLCGKTGIFPAVEKNAAAYIQGWLKRLRGDKHLLVNAAAGAQKATDFILSGSGV